MLSIESSMHWYHQQRILLVYSLNNCFEAVNTKPSEDKLGYTILLSPCGLNSNIQSQTSCHSSATKSDTDIGSLLCLMIALSLRHWKRPANAFGMHTDQIKLSYSDATTEFYVYISGVKQFFWIDVNIFFAHSWLHHTQVGFSLIANYSFTPFGKGRCRLGLDKICFFSCLFCFSFILNKFTYFAFPIHPFCFPCLLTEICHLDH